jgi:hypothetical protein
MRNYLIVYDDVDKSKLSLCLIEHHLVITSALMKVVVLRSGLFTPGIKPPAPIG